MSEKEHPQLSGKKSKLFTLIAVILPLILLAGIEVLLRVFGYGHDTGLFIRYPDNDNYWVMNKYASERYFTDTANATKGNIEPFLVQKPANTCRIFVLGESTTAGYPYMHNGSFHRWLQYRLMHTYPDVHFEVINVSLTAVNSYTVLDFGKQVVKYQPDAVLVYAGHNEYYGALGVGSTSHMGNNRFLIQSVIALRRFRLAQLIEAAMGSFKSHSKDAVDQRETLMKRMAAQQDIAYRSAAYQVGVNQYHDNLDELCRVMQQSRIPVFLSTLVSNEKDQKPFISDNKKPDLNAGGQYQLANANYLAGDYKIAKEQYIMAKELDLLRFRAPEAMNECLLQLAKKYNNVHLVDAKRIFEQHSPHQILGSETLLEHVHPNLYGYALLSDAFYHSIQQAHLIKARAAGEMSFTDLLKNMPVTRIDSLYGAYTIMMLQAGWPFNKPIPAGFKRGTSLDKELAGAVSVNRISWIDAINRLFQASLKANDKPTALKAVEAVMMEYPLNTSYKIFAGRLSYDLKNYANAIYYLKAAYEQDPSFGNLQNMYLVYLKTDQPEKSLGYITYAVKMQGQNPQLPALQFIVKEIIRLKNQPPTDRNRNMQIALDYQKIGIDEAANKYNNN